MSRYVVVYATESMFYAEFDTHEEADAFIQERADDTGGQFVLITIHGCQGNPPDYKVETWL